MRAAAIVLAVLLVLAHPVAAAAILGAGLAVCAVLGWLIVRRFRAAPYLYWRTA